ncbi:MAG: hypothetical protein V3W19_11970 [Desulfatiglandales bacterium]
MKPEIFPVQRSHLRSRDQASVPEAVYMAAYEVYSEVYSPQQAMIEDGCRGGFGLGELTAFLYARSFPKDEWRKRSDEAFSGMNL